MKYTTSSYFKDNMKLGTLFPGNKRSINIHCFFLSFLGVTHFDDFVSIKTDINWTWENQEKGWSFFFMSQAA